MVGSSTCTFPADVHIYLLKFLPSAFTIKEMAIKQTLSETMDKKY